MYIDIYISMLIYAFLVTRIEIQMYIYIYTYIYVYIYIYCISDPKDCTLSQLRGYMVHKFGVLLRSRW